MCPILCCGSLATDPNDGPMAERDGASAAQRGRVRRVRCHWRRGQLLVRMALAAAVRHRRDRTRTAAVQVGRCVEQNVYVPVLEFQEGVADQTVDFSPGSASAPGLHLGTARGADYGFRSTANHGAARGGLCLRSTSTSTLCSRQWLVPQIKENIPEVFQAQIQDRIHEHIVDPSFPRSAVVGSGKRANLSVTLRRRSGLKWRWHGREKRRRP